jgi:hypothetical protein
MYDTLASAHSGPRLPGRPKRSALRRVTRILAILTCVTLVGGAAWYLLMFLITDTESSSSAISTSVRNVELTIDSGDVEVDVVGQGEKPELHKELTSSLRSPDETIKQEGDTLHVTTRCGDGVGKCASDYRLTVPADTLIKVKTSMGDVSVKGVRASAEARTEMGDVRLEHVTGERLVAVSKTGDITVKDAKFDIAEATTKLGDVGIEDIGAFKKLTAASKTGDVEVNLPENAGPFDVNADTSIGDRKVTVDQDSSSGTSVDARTKIGDVTVRAD